MWFNWLASQMNNLNRKPIKVTYQIYFLEIEEQYQINLVTILILHTLWKLLFWSVKNFYCKDEKLIFYNNNIAAVDSTHNISLSNIFSCFIYFLSFAICHTHLCTFIAMNKIWLKNCDGNNRFFPNVAYPSP